MNSFFKSLDEETKAFNSREDLRKREAEVVNMEEVAKIDCMNLAVGGAGSFDIINEKKLNNKVGQCYLGANATKLKFKYDEEFKNKFRENNSKRLINDYKNGLREIKYFYDWNGKKHSEESKKKISESKKGKNLGDLNSQFGTCWITKDGVNKKIKKEELNNFTQQGWVKGRR
jgi:hypothetical protein